MVNDSCCNGDQFDCCRSVIPKFLLGGTDGGVSVILVFWWYCWCLFCFCGDNGILLVWMVMAAVREVVVISSNDLLVFLAALSSSRLLVVCPLVSRLIGRPL